MAQPKNRRREERAKSAEQKERENLEKKADLFVQRRNELNDQANLLRSERNLLNDKKKELLAQMDAAKKERDGHNARLREHKEQRNAYQQQAKLLIAKQRGEKKKAQQAMSPVFRVKELEAEIRDQEYQQQTTVMTVKEENKLIDSIRKKRVELGTLRKDAVKAEALNIDLRNTSQAIDQLFALADAEHQEVLRYYKLAQEAHERFLQVFNETSQIIAASNAKHQELVQTRQRADDQHQQFLELRAKVLELKGKEALERQEARTIIREQHKRVREAVADPKKLEEAAETTLERLKKGGRISLG